MKKLNAAGLVVAGVAFGGFLFAWGPTHPWLAPGLLAASTLALAILLAIAKRRLRVDASKEGEVDPRVLGAIQLSRLKGWIKENLRGHDPIVDDVVDRIQTSLSLAGTGRPLGAYLLVGPTGTGKTFLTQLVAQAMFPKSEPLVLNMNQYKHPDDVFTLIGPPPGRPGSEIGGTLTRPVLENPYRVILLDELEKSHLDVRHCLYDILDTGKCREKSSGRTVHFHGSVFFATSNGSVEALRRNRASEANDGGTGLIELDRRALVEGGDFERAFLARWDGIFLMDALTPVQVAEVAGLQLVKHWRQFGIDVAYTSPEVLVGTLRKNLEYKEFGVRQLLGVIKRSTDPLIADARKAGAKRVRLDVDPLTGKFKATRV